MAIPLALDDTQEMKYKYDVQLDWETNIFTFQFASLSICRHFLIDIGQFLTSDLKKRASFKNNGFVELKTII